MSWHPGGAVRCASATYAGRFVIEGPNIFDEFTALLFTMGGNARQRRRQVRALRRLGHIVTPGGVAS